MSDDVDVPDDLEVTEPVTGDVTDIVNAPDDVTDDGPDDVADDVAGGIDEDADDDEAIAPVAALDLETRGLTLDQADGSRALDEVNLFVPEGTSLAICGPARAGKTQLLRILVGLDDPSDGDVVLGEAVANRRSARDRNMAMVFSDFPLHPHMDAYDNLAFSALLRRHQPEADIDERVEHVADLLGLTSVLDDRPGHLDDSQRQRIGLGRALVRDADYYLFDDPFTAQDPRLRGHVRSVTAQWQRDLGRTSIFTTRTPEEALTLSEQVAVMNLGWIHQVGTPQELYDLPADLFVAGFMGNPVMNLVPGRPEGTSVRLPFATVPISDEWAERLEGLEHVIVGIRPEHCFDGSSPEAARVTNPIRFTARVDDIEYAGRTQQVYMGYALDPETEEHLTAIEDDFEYDLFQNFFVAQLSAASYADEGSDLSIVVPSANLHFFDLETAGAL